MIVPVALVAEDPIGLKERPPIVCPAFNRDRLAVGETVILLNPPLPLVGVSIETMRECQQIDSLANGYDRHFVRTLDLLLQGREREQQDRGHQYDAVDKRCTATGSRTCDTRCAKETLCASRRLCAH